MGAIWAIACKDLRLLLRDRMGFFFAFFFPLIIAIFFGVIFAKSESSGKIDVLLVDEDRSEQSAAFAKTLSESEELSVTSAESKAAAVETVRAGKGKAALIVLPKGFGGSRQGMFWSTGSTIELGVDPSRRAEAGMLEGILTKYGFMQFQQMFDKPDMMREQIRMSRERLKTDSEISPLNRMVFDRFFSDLDSFFTALPEAKEPAKADGTSPSADAAKADESPMEGWQPLTIKPIDIVPPKPTGSAPQSSFAITFPQGIIWGVMGCALGFATSLVSERTRGTLMRLRVAPISSMQILMGKALACFMATQAVSIFLVAIGVLVFGVRPTSWPMLAIAIVATGICFVGIMMLLAVLSPSERGGNGLGWGVLLIFSMIGGGMIPLFFMPVWMKSLSIFSPIRWAILSIEGGLWRNSTPADMLVPVAVLLGIGALGFAIGIRGMRHTSAQ